MFYIFTGSSDMGVHMGKKIHWAVHLRSIWFITHLLFSSVQSLSQYNSSDPEFYFMDTIYTQALKNFTSGVGHFNRFI